MGTQNQVCLGWFDRFFTYHSDAFGFEERLRAYDAPLREKEIEKSTEEHHRLANEAKRAAEGTSYLMLGAALITPC